MSTLRTKMRVIGVTQGEGSNDKPYTRVDGFVEGLRGARTSWFAPSDAANLAEGDVIDFSGSVSVKPRSWTNDSGEKIHGINASVTVEEIHGIVRGGVTGLAEALASVGADSTPSAEGDPDF